MTEPDASDTATSLPYRGDFMLLPPLKPTFGTMAMIQQPSRDYLVTRRPTAVADTELTHTVDMQVAGRVRSRARRQLRPSAPQLDHLITPADDFDDVDEQPPPASLPPAPRPRRMAAKTRTGAPPAPPASTLPTPDAVRRRVSSPASVGSLRPIGSGGWDRAEVTSGGVPLGELDRRTLASRHDPRVRFCGEVVNVTGRLGGFNFQWAWSSGFVAGHSLRATLDRIDG